MTAVIGTPVRTTTRPLSHKLAGLFVGGVMVTQFGGIPVQGRTPMTLMTIVALASIFLFTKHELLKLRLSLPIVAFAAWSMYTVRWSVAPDVSSFVLNVNVPNALLLMLIASVLPLRQLGEAMLKGAYVTTLIQLAGVVIQPGITLIDAESGYQSFHGYFIHKNVLSPYLAFVIALALAIDRNAARRRLMVVLCAVMILASLSATGFAAMLFVIGFDWLIKRLATAEPARQVQMLLSGLASALAFAFLWTTYLPGILSLYGKDTTFTGRTGIWKVAIWAIRQRPWTGYGVDATWVESSVVYAAAQSRLRFTATHAHNGVLELWLGLGLVGVLLFAVLFLATLRGVWPAALAGSDVARAGLVIMMALVVVSISESFFSWPWVALLIPFRIHALRWRAGEREEPAENGTNALFRTESGGS